ncbi:MAG: hypothetical protein RL434_650 [Pseudomonadota bacterium]|jgi:hypothetical protein
MVVSDFYTKQMLGVFASCLPGIRRAGSGVRFLTSVADRRQKSVTESVVRDPEGHCKARGGRQEQTQAAKRKEVRIDRTRCARQGHRENQRGSAGKVQQKERCSKRQAQVLTLAIGMLDIKKDKHGARSGNILGFPGLEQAGCQSALASEHSGKARDLVIRNRRLRDATEAGGARGGPQRPGSRRRGSVEASRIGHFFLAPNARPNVCVVVARSGTSCALC